jgi:hypothetical protein
MVTGANGPELYVRHCTIGEIPMKARKVAISRQAETILSAADSATTGEAMSWAWPEAPEPTSAVAFIGNESYRWMDP